MQILGQHPGPAPVMQSPSCVRSSRAASFEITAFVTADARDEAAARARADEDGVHGVALSKSRPAESRLSVITGFRFRT